MLLSIPELVMKRKHEGVAGFSVPLMIFSIENGSPKRPFVAAWGSTRLDENKDFRTDGA